MLNVYVVHSYECKIIDSCLLIAMKCDRKAFIYDKVTQQNVRVLYSIHNPHTWSAGSDATLQIVSLVSSRNSFAIGHCRLTMAINTAQQLQTLTFFSEDMKAVHSIAKFSYQKQDTLGHLVLIVLERRELRNVKNMLCAIFYTSNSSQTQ